MVKKRSIQQKTEDESKGKFIELFKDWIVNPIENDFGFDFEVRLTNSIDKKTQEVSPEFFLVQNKSSIISKGESTKEDLSITDWELYLGQKVPVLIVKYDVSQKTFYWEITQNYLWDIIEKEDKNWRRQKTKRIILTKKIVNLEEIKKEILETQKRITRYHALNLGIGEGIKITKDDFSSLIKNKEKALLEFKALSLNQYYLLRKKGDLKTAHETIFEVYNSPKNDEAKVRAIIGLIYELNLADEKENIRIVSLAEEGMKIANDLNLNYLKEFIIIYKNHAILFMVIKKISEIQLSLKIQESANESFFSYFYKKEFTTLTDLQIKIIEDMNNSLKNLLLNKDIYYYISSLSIILDTITFQIMAFGVFNPKIIDEEIQARKTIIDECEFILKTISEDDLKKGLFRSLAHYYYWTKNHEKAIECIESALEIGIKDEDKFFVSGNSKILEKMKLNKNPYNITSNIDISKLSTEEYQDYTKNILKFQGINLEATDELSNHIKIALEDMNPEEYFKYCENLHIRYIGTSPVGMAIGLPTMGNKRLWCKYSNSSIQGFNLKLVFQSFITENCHNCKYLKKRDNKWKCVVEWVEKQEKLIPIKE